MEKYQNFPFMSNVPCLALISSVPLWGWPSWKHRGQHRSGQPEKLHLLLQASQPGLSTTSRRHGDIVSLERPEPARPVWPGMQSSYQDVSTRVHPQQAGHCHSVERHTASLCPPHKKHPDSRYTSFNFVAEQNTRLLRVTMISIKGLHDYPEIKP